MSEIIELGLKQWENASSDELGLTFPGLTVERTRYPNDKKQQFNIIDIDARGGKPGPVILSSASFDFRDQPLSEAQMKILAVQSGARVMWSEIPGITMNLEDPMNTHGDFQTLKQTMLAFSGNFDPLAAEQLKAFYEIGHLENEEEIQLLGKSLAAYDVIAMGRTMAQGKYFPHKLNVTRIDAIEPVNAYGNYTLLRQAKMLINLAKTEDQRRQLYLAENKRFEGPEESFGAYEKISDDTLRADKHVKRRQVIATYATGAGLRKGLDVALTDMLHAAPNLRNATLSFGRAADSTVSFEKDLQSAAQTVIENGGKAETLKFIGEEGNTMPYGHHVWDALAIQASYAVARKARIDAEKI